MILRSVWEHIRAPSLSEICCSKQQDQPWLVQLCIGESLSIFRQKKTLRCPGSVDLWNIDRNVLKFLVSSKVIRHHFELAGEPQKIEGSIRYIEHVIPRSHARQRKR